MSSLPQYPVIIDRGRGPEIAGTRITVFHVLEYQMAGMHRDAIATSLWLSSQQVEVAMKYIEEHREVVTREYEAIRERIRRGNPPWVREKLRESHAKLEALRQRLESEANESGAHAQGNLIGQ